MEDFMKKKLLMVMVMFAVFALLFTACPDGDKGGGGEPPEWPDFANAFKLERTQFMKEGEGFITEWGFKHEGVENEDFGAPHNSKTFLTSKFLIIATKGGGTVGGSPNDPKTEFNQNGFEPIKFKVDAANGNWEQDYVENTFRLKPTDVPNWIVAFPHIEEEIIYFVYKLDNFITSFSNINKTNSRIVFKIAWGPDEKSLGFYQAYITSADLTQGSGGVLIHNQGNNAGDTTLADGVSLGWITRDTGLTPAQ